MKKDEKMYLVALGIFFLIGAAILSIKAKNIYDQAPETKPKFEDVRVQLILP
jgi:hypothetical protein